MTDHELQRQRLVELVASARNQRLRPRDANRALAQELGIPRSTVNEVVKGLVEDGELVYSYRDPCSYLEIPCNGCDGGHRAARPMRVVMDGNGDPWLCDEGLDPSMPTEGAGCWECGGFAFTRSG